MARRKKLENTSLEEQLEYVEQEIRTKESDLKELRHKAKEIQKEIEEKQKDELFKALVIQMIFIDHNHRYLGKEYVVVRSCVFAFVIRRFNIYCVEVKPL